jgi:hypothetical protein
VCLVVRHAQAQQLSLQVLAALLLLLLLVNVVPH